MQWKRPAKWLVWRLWRTNSATKKGYILNLGNKGMLIIFLGYQIEVIIVAVNFCNDDYLLL